MKIDGIGFENFRIFKDKNKFELAPITVLTGTNSSGKTTIIKALKLFQTFWAQEGFGHHLDFEKGNHQLGDFEMALSKKSNKKELIITYEFNHIVFDSLCIELVFQTDATNPLKNGFLKNARIKKDNIIVYTIMIKNNDVFAGYNYKYILEVLSPMLIGAEEHLKTEFHNYSKILRDNTEKRHEGIYFIDSTKSNLKRLKIDANRYEQLISLLYFDFSVKSETPEFLDFNFKTFPFIYDLELLNLFSQFTISKSINFIDELWRLLREKYPEIENRFSYKTFIDFVENAENQGKLSINLWKESFLLSGEKSFELFLKKQIELSHNIISKSFVNCQFGIMDTNSITKNKFHHLTRIYFQTIWGAFYESAINSTTQNDDEKAIVSCHQIVSDAMFLEKELLGKDIKHTTPAILSMFEKFFTNMYKTIEQSFSQMYFVDSIRATSQRLYSSDYQGSDFSNFIKDFLKCNYSKKESTFLEKWLQEFEIADKLEIELIRGAGSQIFFIKDDEKINLVDLGYGVTQFLPILLKIIYCNNIGKKRIVIEEPETNLHPKFQSKLADLFIDAFKTFELHFIVETHSEYLIRKLQFLTANGEINTEDTILYYIGNPNPQKREKGEEQVRKIQILKNGRLSKPFGSGFYDEADNLSLAMMKFSLN